MEFKFELTFEGGEDSLDVRSFDAHEELSTPYEVNVLARSPKHDIDLEAIVGKPASLVVRNANPHVTATERCWEGICNVIEHTKAEEEAGVRGLSTYWLRIVPRLWLMTRNREHRIFQRKSIVEVVKRVLLEWDIKPQLELVEAYKDLDYVVQYGESDFAFVSRLLERAGITYTFDFTGDKTGELTLNDQPHATAPRPAITYNPKVSARVAAENIHKVRLAERVAPGRFTLRDYDFRRPDFKLLGEAPPAKAPEDFYEQYHYLPGASLYLDPAGAGGTPVADDKGKVRSVDAEGKARAERGLQAERCTKQLVGFETNCLDLWPGTVFTMEEHPRAELAKALLVTSFSLTGTANEEWRQVGEAVFAAHPYRPFERTPRPTIQGIQSAIVVGPEGEEIYTDEFGRVRVQFHWDRDGKLDVDSSCWIRVSQGWAGKGYGKIVIPRIGQEVLVGFYEGDPDQPVIVGRAYNTLCNIPSEQELPRYKTRSTWMSDTSPHQDGAFNEIRFEDEKDKEFVYTQAQKDQQQLVKRHETERTGQNHASVVGLNRAAVVGAVDSVLVGKKYSIQMIQAPKPDQLKITQMGKPEVAPLSTKLEMVDKQILCTSGEATAIIDGKDITFEATRQITFKAGGKVVIHGGPNIHVNPKGGGSAQAGCLEEGSDVGAPFVEKAK